MSNHPPRVGIIILQWRRVHETVTCLRSLRGLVYGNYDVLVVDNHSADGSVERLRAEIPGVTIEESPTNLGFAGGCNVGIKRILTDPEVGYVLLLNNDTTVSPALLDEMVGVAEAEPRAAAVGAINLAGDSHTSSGGRIDWWTGRYVDILDEQPPAWIANRPVIEVEAIAGSSMLLRAEDLRAGELLDPSFFLVFEETDWCLRQRARGRKVLLATRARLEHRVSASMGRPLHFYFRFRNRPFFMARHARAYHWLTFLPYYALEAAARVCTYVLAGRTADARGVLLGVWDAARGVRGPGRLASFADE